ncbi:MAG: N-acetylmuramoyl-L-alanine amidase [Thermoanaerobaculia bacterium]|jgi:N-acetylmuramoyl-L-alanine amidase|nr:N-acetylmuramoyl-L-alanine amidase [Thermoanaerobaculia bacterium]
MTRSLSLTSIALASAFLLLAQAPTTTAPPNPANQATLRAAKGDRMITIAHQNGQTYFAADEVLTALGGSVTREGNGFKASINNAVAAFGTDSRFGVVRDDLIEMPVPPVTIENRPFVPWQFFQGFLLRSSGLDATWDPASRILQIHPAQTAAAGVQVSVANVQGISKVVLTLTAPAEYAIVKEPDAYTIRFRSAIKAPYVEQAHEDPYVAKTSFIGNDLRIQLTAADVVGDAYKLDNPFRIVLDLRKGAVAAPGAPQPLTSSKPVESPGIHTIVIDPGHGGKEVGAIGPGGLMEKDATLAVCTQLAAALEAKLKTRVILTRSDDTVVPLDQRTAIANQYHADLFLSVHMNAAIVKGAHGAETYFLSLDASDKLAEKAAEVENASAKNAAAPPSSSDLKLILWDLAQQEYLNESSRLAQAVQEEMNRITGIQSRGVKQAPFKVLVGATMPAALVEVAFITNPDEESKIKSEAFQKTVVDALTAAVARYKVDYETRIGVAQPPAPALSTAPTSTAPATPTSMSATTATAPGAKPPAPKPTTATTPTTTSTATKPAPRTGT